MKSKTVHLSVAAASVALVLAACGGGGGSSSSGATNAAALQLSGTAAVGAALVGATVEVKCGTGTGTATTTSSGGYTVSMTGGALPCMVRVTGTSPDGTSVTLHSVVETGTSTNGTTAAVANVTPITEMIVAQLMEAMPADAFTSFTPQSVTQTALATATTTIVDALKAAGVDLGAIDPLKATLVPASGSTAGNTYDQLLDQLGQTVSAESLPLLVSQIAAAAATDSSTGLTDSMTAVSSGALENCPSALSGKYRTIDYTGGTQVHMLDFKAMTWTTEGGSTETIVASSQACEFSVNTAKAVIGPQGAGAFQEADQAGWLFPVQSHSLSTIAGTWNFLESGVDESNAGSHFFGKFTINADGSTALCEHNPMGGVANFGSCAPTTDTQAAVADGAGGFTIGSGVDEAKAYGYRALNGELHMFGTSNPAGNPSPAYRSQFVMVKPQALPLPPVGDVVRYWDVEVHYTGSLAGSTHADSTTVTASDSGAGTFTRVRASDSRVDTLKINHPVEGLRYRSATGGIPAVYQMQVPSLGLAATIDDMPAAHFFAISVRRP